MKKLLVIAPRFPSINQPWMDTYLEELLSCDIELGICSSLKEVEPYNEKVDRLKLRQQIILYNDNFSLRIILNNLLKKPRHSLQLIRELPRYLRLARTLNKNHGIQVLESLAKYVSFASERKKFNDFDAIHAHGEIAGYQFCYLAEVLDIPFFITFHGLPPLGVGQLSAAKRQRLYGKARAVFVNTNFSKKTVRSLSCQAQKIHIIPQGLPIEDFPFNPTQFPTNAEPIFLLSVGRFHPDKGQGYILLALRRLRDKKINAHLNLVGVGPKKERLITLTKRLNLTEYVSIHSGIGANELKVLYKEAHFFLLASTSSDKDSSGAHTETQGVVLQEAQASGCIPVASRVGGIPEVLNHDHDGLLVQQRSSNGIASAVIKILNSKERYETYQKNGRLNVENNFSSKVTSQKLLHFLNK